MMAVAHPQFALRPFLIEDTPLLAEIFRASIEELAADDYTAGQQQAWASGADDEEEFARRLEGQLTLIATMNGSPVGFGSLANNETIDLLHMHPAVAGQGAGTMLVDALEKLAAARGAKRLTADDSNIAQEFFTKRGFTAIQPNRHRPVLGRTQARRDVHGLRHDPAARPLDLQRPGPCDSPRCEGGRHLLRGQVVGLPRARRAGDDGRGKSRLDPRQREGRQAKGSRGAD